MSVIDWSNIDSLNAKPKIRILILGSYDDPALPVLRSIKDFIRTKGYINTKLIMDFNNPIRQADETDAEYNLRRTEFWLPKADVVLFIFLKGEFNSSGVGFELQHITNNYPDMMWRSIVAWSQKPRPNVTSLVEGLVDRWKKSTNVIFFGSVDRLCDEIFGVLTSVLGLLKNIVKNRGNEEWELDTR